jgi:hypothetical protein
LRCEAGAPADSVGRAAANPLAGSARRVLPSANREPSAGLRLSERPSEANLAALSWRSRQRPARDELAHLRPDGAFDSGPCVLLRSCSPSTAGNMLPATSQSPLSRCDRWCGASLPIMPQTNTRALLCVPILCCRTLATRLAPAQPVDKLAERWLPKPRISHPWPSQRFRVKHPRWEPYPGIRLYGSVRGAPGDGRPFFRDSDDVDWKVPLLRVGAFIIVRRYSYNC